ncbi:MAG: hypothetical protein WCB53_22410 [Terriglobales bacterium]
MASPAIIWRNPKDVRRRRLWNQARTNASGRIYIVVRSGYGEQAEWEGLPNLEVIDGGPTALASRESNRELRSRR